jgi:hypothetical protein
MCGWITRDVLASPARNVNANFPSTTTRKSAIDDDSRRRVALDLRRLSRGRRLPEVGLNQGCKPVVSEGRRNNIRLENCAVAPREQHRAIGADISCDSESNGGMARPSSGSESSPHHAVFPMTSEEARSQKWQYRFFAYAC